MVVVQRLCYKNLEGDPKGMIAVDKWWLFKGTFVLQKLKITPHKVVVVQLKLCVIKVEEGPQKFSRCRQVVVSMRKWLLRQV